MQISLKAAAAAGFAALAACATAPQGSGSAPAAPEAAPAETAADLGEMADPFILMTSVERYAYLIDLARQGAIDGPPAMTLEDPSELERAARASVHAAHALYALRDRVCMTGLVAPEECGPLPPPAWLGAPVDEVADVAEINRRIDWLTSVMWPFVEAGCDAGRSRQGPDDPDYCAVE
jgi:hypothetical protein